MGPNVDIHVTVMASGVGTEFALQNGLFTTSRMRFLQVPEQVLFESEELLADGTGEVLLQTEWQESAE